MIFRTNLAEEFDWSKDDLYKSNGGKGPMLARIRHVSDGFVHMERWNEGGSRRYKFELPVWYLKGKTCGWVRIR